PTLRASEVPTESRLWAYAAAAAAHGVMGQTGAALRLADEGLLLADQHSDQPMLAVPHVRITRVNVLYLAGRIGDAWTSVESGYRDALSTGDPALTAQWAASRATGA